MDSITAKAHKLVEALLQETSQDEKQYDQGYRDAYYRGKEDGEAGRLQSKTRIDAAFDYESAAYANGFKVGYEVGYKAGREYFEIHRGRGFIESLTPDELYDEEFDDGTQHGFEDGYSDGFDGYRSRLKVKDDTAYDSGYAKGYEQGYAKGREENLSGAITKEWDD